MDREILKKKCKLHEVGGAHFSRHNKLPAPKIVLTWGPIGGKLKQECPCKTWRHTFNEEPRAVDTKRLKTVLKTNFLGRSLPPNAPNGLDEFKQVTKSIVTI